jgi:hypothetical protein
MSLPNSQQKPDITSLIYGVVYDCILVYIYIYFSHHSYEQLCSWSVLVKHTTKERRNFYKQQRENKNCSCFHQDF